MAVINRAQYEIFVLGYCRTCATIFVKLCSEMCNIVLNLSHICCQATAFKWTIQGSISGAASLVHFSYLTDTSRHCDFLCCVVAGMIQLHSQQMSIMRDSDIVRRPNTLLHTAQCNMPRRVFWETSPNKGVYREKKSGAWGHVPTQNPSDCNWDSQRKTADV